VHDGEDVALEATELEAGCTKEAERLVEWVRGLVGRISRQRSVDDEVVRPALRDLNPGKIASELSRGIECFIAEKDEVVIWELRAEAESSFRRVAAATRREARAELKAEKKKIAKRVERVRRASNAEVGISAAEAAAAAAEIDAEWAAKLSTSQKEIEQLHGQLERLASVEALLARREDEAGKEKILTDGTTDALRRQCSVLSQRLKHTQEQVSKSQTETGKCLFLHITLELSIPEIVADCTIACLDASRCATRQCCVATAHRGAREQSPDGCLHTGPQRHERTEL